MPIARSADGRHLQHVGREQRILRLDPRAHYGRPDHVEIIAEHVVDAECDIDAALAERVDPGRSDHGTHSSAAMRDVRAAPGDDVDVASLTTQQFVATTSRPRGDGAGTPASNADWGEMCLPRDS